MDITPFTVDVSGEELAELHRRLDAARLPDGRESLAELLGHWRRLDWPAQQERINHTPQFLAEAGERTVHFARIRPERVTRGAVLLLHGWPDSFLRFEKVWDRLAGAGFDVVVPSLPGFGFSSGGAASSRDTAELFAGLMSELGHERFLVAAGDLGTGAVLALGRQHRQRLVGAHLLDIGYPSIPEQDLTSVEREWADFIAQWFATEGGYAHVQSTKPQIIGPALTDSPAGLAAWMLGFIEAGAVDGDVAAAFGGLDELLVNLSLYWFTRTGGSAADAYAADGWGGDTSRVEVPTAVLVAPRDSRPPREWCERQATVVRYTTLAEGGHFLPLECPQAYTDDLLAFADQLAGH
ncbi:epoxide hydrolase [Naumannella sp. ID2617S]|nr:epoxide hydrolase [Naumannella sp. ID2617S]